MMDSPYMAPWTPSPNPQSNVEIHELEDWLGQQFPYDSIPGEVECVPASKLLNPSSFSIALESVQGRSPEEQILAQCRSTFLQVMSYHYDRNSFGGSQIFIPSMHFFRAYTDAQQKSVQLCRKLSEQKEYECLSTCRIVERLAKFVNDAVVKIGRINRSNSLRYLERNKKNELEKFVDTLEERYKFLYPASSVNSTCVINFYNSKQMDEDIAACIIDVLKEWNSIKRSVLGEYEGQDGDSQRFEYRDDVESGLNAYKVQILLGNEKHVEKYLLDSLDREYSNCKQDIDKAIDTANYLDEISKTDFHNRVQGFKTTFEQEFNAIVEEHINPNKQNEFKSCFISKLGEKERQLMQHANDELEVEIGKARNALHAEFKTDFGEFLRKLQEKHRLKKGHLIYEQQFVRALNNAKLQIDKITPETTGGNDSDEENSRVGSSSSGTSREPMSVSNLNVITRQSGDTTGTLAAEEYRPDISIKEDCDSGETVIISPPRSKRFRKSTGEKVTTTQ